MTTIVLIFANPSSRFLAAGNGPYVRHLLFLFRQELIVCVFPAGRTARAENIQQAGRRQSLL